MITIPFANEATALLGFLIIISALYMQGQSFVDPTIRAISIQSFLLSILFAILAIQFQDLVLFYLAALTAVIRGIIIPRIMQYQVRKFKDSLRETGTGQRRPSLRIVG